MEIPIIESGIIRFQNPNSLARLFHLTDLKSLWTWGALILASIAAFSTVIRRTKLVILRFHKGKSVIPYPSSDSFSSDDEDESCSSSDDDEDELSSSEDDCDNYEECQEQNVRFDNNSSWSELGRGVVKSWDELGLGFDQSSGSISLLDLNRNEIFRSFLSSTGEIQAVHVAPASAILTAEAENGGNVAVKFWDARAGDEAPATTAVATWQADRRGKVVGIGGREGMVYVADDGGMMSVVDLRNVGSTLGETWWWGDGAVTVRDGEGLVSWCRNAARCLTPI